jgi:hypothetical protein
MQGERRSGYPPEMARFAELGVCGGMLDLMSSPPIEIGMKLRGAEGEVPLDPSRGASFQNRPREISGKTLPTFFVHPPYRQTKGYTFWAQDVTVPEQAELRFSIGMGKLSPERSDGVRFEVHVAKVEDGVPGDYEKIFEQTTNQHRWLPQVVSLADWAGEHVRLKFVADCGPEDNATTDHAHWGDVKIVGAGTTEEEITRSVERMTWVNEDWFRSGFFYRHVRSRQVDLTFAIEGNQPVTLRSVTVHAHADAIYRVFEQGIVLANPSLKPYTFDLSRLSPGRSYRRIQATANQDTETNNGQPVGSSVTLGEREGLFLLRTD